MKIQLTNTELNETRQLLEEYKPAQEAIAILEENNGLLEVSFEQLWQTKNGRQSMPEGKSLWKVTKKVLRQDICGDDGFRAKVKEYNQKKGTADASPLLTGAIVYVVGLITLPIDPAISKRSASRGATIIVLYIMKVGLDIFCEYTDPD